MSTARPFWPCPNHCETWCRTDIAFRDGKPLPMTNHHPRCQFVDETLIDVWRVSANGTSYVTDREPAADEASPEEYTITKERMHREIYENLPEFEGF